jgi:hypothetical protein
MKEKERKSKKRGRKVERNDILEVSARLSILLGTVEHDKERNEMQLLRLKLHRCFSVLTQTAPYGLR